MATKRRTRSPHPGVVLIRPDGQHHAWRARYVDPDTGKHVKERLDPQALRTAEARRDWAIRKAKAIAKRRMELEAGAPRATGTSLETAVGRYFEDHPQLRGSTLDLYRVAVDKLLAWAARARLAKADDVTGERLMAFRATLIREKRRVPVAGGKRGEMRVTDEPRAPSTVNVELRAVRSVLGYLRELGLLPRVTSDNLRDGLKRLEAPTEAVDYLRPPELRRLLDAALEHDAETFAATRAEHKGKAKPGSTARYQQIAPFVAGVLLSGMRFDEALSLDWGQVDLEALDHDGKPVGEIRLTTKTKTKKPRTVGLEVSPALRRLLLKLQPDPARGRVFGLTRGAARAAERRLRGDFGAPGRVNWQALRQTCGSYLTCAPGIFGAASAYRSAKQLGHSVAVAEKYYVGTIRGIPADARDLETAMQITDQLNRIVEAARPPGPARARRIG